MGSTGVAPYPLGYQFCLIANCQAPHLFAKAFSHQPKIKESRLVSNAASCADRRTWMLRIVLYSFPSRRLKLLVGMEVSSSPHTSLLCSCLLHFQRVSYTRKPNYYRTEGGGIQNTKESCTESSKNYMHVYTYASNKTHQLTSA